MTSRGDAQATATEQAMINIALHDVDLAIERARATVPSPALDSALGKLDAARHILLSTAIET